MKKVKKYFLEKERNKKSRGPTQGEMKKEKHKRKKMKTHPVLYSVKPLRTHGEISDYLEDLIIFVICKVSPAVE